MPDLFDGFFGKVLSRMNGGKQQKRHYSLGQVNTGNYYMHHSLTTNNGYWMTPKREEEKPMPPVEFAGGMDGEDHFKARKQLSFSILSQPELRLRFGSVSSENLN